MEEQATSPETPEGLLREGWRLMDLRQSALAADKLTRLVRSLPPHGPLYETACAQLSSIYHQQGKLKKAISMLRQAIKQAPRNAVYRLNLAQLYKEDNNETRAMNEAKRALLISPDLVEARELVAELMLEQGRADTTLQEAREILRRSPHNLRALDLMGTAYLYQGKLASALQIVNQMILLSPADPSFHFKRAVLLQQLGEVRSALGSFLRVIDMAPATEIGVQSMDAVQALDEYQIRQILLLASEDAMFRYSLSQNVEYAIRQRGYFLSPAGIAALAQVEFEGVIPFGQDQGFRLMN
jgi:tetratricopeptide (TPR) repeat protein